MLERGLRNPWLRPFVLIFLCLLLGLVFIHAVHDGHDVFTDAGATCVAFALFFVFALIIPRVRAPRGVTPVVRSARAPPRLFALTTILAIDSSGFPPLRL